MVARFATSDWQALIQYIILTFSWSVFSARAFIHGLFTIRLSGPGTEVSLLEVYFRRQDYIYDDIGSR